MFFSSTSSLVVEFFVCMVLILVLVGVTSFLLRWLPGLVVELFVWS